jgi:hypothetical protein
MKILNTGVTNPKALNHVVVYVMDVQYNKLWWLPLAMMKSSSCEPTFCESYSKLKI